MTPRLIHFYGDSVMAGYTVRPTGGVVSEHNLPATCGSLLGAAAICRNFGIGGTTTPEWLFGRGAVPRPWAEEMALSGPQYVAINTGINDAYVPNYSPADHAWCYQELTRIARAAGRTMVFVSPNPINTGHNAALWGLKHTVDGVAGQMGVPVINIYDAIAYGCPSWQAMLPDTVHPSDDLHRYMGHVAFMTLAPILRAAGVSIP